MPAANILSDLARSGFWKIKAYQYTLDVPATNGVIAMGSGTNVIVPKGASIVKARVAQINRTSAITVAGTNASRLILYRDAATDDILCQMTPVASGTAISAASINDIHCAGFWNPSANNVALADATEQSLKLGVGTVGGSGLALASGAGFSKISTGLAKAFRVQFWVAIPNFESDPDNADPMWAA